MEWIEVKIATTSEAVEIVTGLLMAFNIPNVRIVDDEAVGRFLLDHPLNWDYKDDETVYGEGAEIIFYLQNDEVERALLAEVSEALYRLPAEISEIDFGDLLVKDGPVNDDDWLHEWKKTYKTFKIGAGVVVRPYWEDYAAAEGETVFAIDPGAVFGTGLHGTTQLCVLALEEMGLAGETVLDIGCGSGILSVIALLLGAGSAVACDIDPGAARCAMENAQLNGVDSRYEAFTGNIFEGVDFLPSSPGKKYDVVVANIVADVIIGLAPLVGEYLADGGTFVSSGIIDERAEEVKNALLSNGFVIKKTREQDGWFSYTCQSIL